MANGFLVSLKFTEGFLRLEKRLHLQMGFSPIRRPMRVVLTGRAEAGDCFNRFSLL